MLDQAREFLARVIPWPQPGEHGFVNIHWTFPPTRPNANGKPAWSGRAATSVSEASKAIEYALKSNTLDVYACMSMQSTAIAKTTAKKGFKYNAPVRRAENVIALKSFFLDIDLKGPPKGYNTPNELMDELAKFIVATNLPRPTLLVASGGGVHVYWVVDRPLPPEEWLPIAHALAEATRVHGLRCDTQCTVDSARVLRVPDTFNRKESTPRNVHFIGNPLDFDYSVDRVRTALQPYMSISGRSVGGALSIDRQTFPARPAVLGDDELQAGLANLWPAPDVDNVGRACAFVGDALQQGGRHYDNPLWNLTTLVSTFTKGGRADAHRMANQHAEYSQAETDALFDRKDREKHERGLGWPSCAAISAAGAKACSTCAFRAQGKSPLNFEQRPATAAAGSGLGGSVATCSGGNGNGAGAPALTQTPFGAAATTNYQAPPIAAPVAPAGNDLPNGYQRDAQGYVHKIVPDPGNPGGNILMRVADYPMLGAWLQKNPHILHFQSVVELNHVTQIDLPFEVTATNEMRKTLQGQGFMLPAKDSGSGEFFVAWINKLQQIKQMVNSSPFGWINSNGHIDGFVFGDRMWTPTGNEPAATPDPTLAHRYRPKGTETFWLDATKLVCGCGRPDLEALVASAFAAPLMTFTGHKGALMSAFSRESGVGKSTAVIIAQSVWGSPVKGIQMLDDTENSTMDLVGALRSLPLYWDELKSEQQTKKFVNMTFKISLGKGKSRLDSKARQKEPGEWQTLVISASNESIVDHVAGHTSTTAAGIMRVFEYRVTSPSSSGRVSTTEAQVRTGHLNNNYGHVGLRYAQFLGANHGKIASDMAALSKQVEQETEATQEERFWIGVVSCILLGARYAHQIGYPIFDEAALKDFMYRSLDGMRQHRASQTVDLDQSLNVSAVMNTFFKETKKNGTWMITNRIHVGAGKPPRPPSPNAIKILYPTQHEHLKGVDVQVGVDNKLLRISTSALGQWCKKNEVNKQNLLEALSKSVTITPVRNGRMGAGTPYASANEHIIEIDLTSSNDFDFVSEMV